MYFKSSFRASEDTGGSCLGLGIFILIWIWSLVVGRSVFQILALYLDFEGAKNINVLKVLIWGFVGLWRFPTGVLHSDIDFGMVTGFLFTHILNFGSLS